MARPSRTARLAPCGISHEAPRPPGRPHGPQAGPTAPRPAPRPPGRPHGPQAGPTAPRPAPRPPGRPHGPYARTREPSRRPKEPADRPENSAKPQVTELDCTGATEVPPCSQYRRTPRKGAEMANPANYAISLGLLIAVLAAILATKRTPATAGAALPLLAAAGGRQPAHRTGTDRATTRKGTGKANGNGEATRTGNGQTSAAPARTPGRAKAEPSTAPAVNPVSGTQR